MMKRKRNGEAYTAEEQAWLQRKWRDNHPWMRGADDPTGLDPTPACDSCWRSTPVRIEH